MIEIDRIKSNLASIRTKAVNIQKNSTGQNKTRALAIITLVDTISPDVLIVENHIAKNTLTPQQIEEVLQPIINKLKR